MHSGEPQFEACRQSIASQTHTDHELLVVSGLGKREANQTFWRAFYERRDELDLMFILGADMVLRRADFLERLVERFDQHPEVDMMMFTVQDWLPDTPVWGVHAYRSTVSDHVVSDSLFTDQVSVPRERQLRYAEDLAPAADHCSDPTPWQAFHYGLHRGMKVMQHDRADKRGGAARAHLLTLERIWDQFVQSGDVRHGFAVLGAELAFIGAFAPSHINYTDPYALKVFRTHEALDTNELTRLLRRLRRRTGGGLTANWRLPLLWHRHARGFQARPEAWRTAGRELLHAVKRTPILRRLGRVRVQRAS